MSDNNSNNNSNFSKSFFAGTFGGFLGTILSHPFDTIRIRIQTENKYKYRGFIDLYKGVVPPLYGIALEKTLVFGSYNYVNDNLQKKYPKQSILNHGLSGLVAGLVCTSIVTPVERIKIIRQTSTKYSNSEKFLSHSFKENGVRNTLYRGWTSTLTREIPGYAIYFSTYEYLKKDIFKNNPNHIQTFLMGGFCGAFSWVFIYPSDVIKSRMQSEDSKIKYNGVIDCIKKSIKSDGYKVFYKGFYTSLLRAIPLHAGVFTGYEIFMKF